MSLLGSVKNFFLLYNEQRGGDGSVTEDTSSHQHHDQRESINRMGKPSGNANNGSDVPSLNLSQHESFMDLPIVYHYLTLESPLPPPTVLASPSDSSAPVPPDLSKYGSPFDWPESRKSILVYGSCIATMVTAYAVGAYSPPSAQM